MMRRFCLTAALIGLISAAPSAFPRELTSSEARELVVEALRDRGTLPESPGFMLQEEQPSDFPGFYNFEATLVDQRMRDLGYYSVDRKTAEVWESSVWCHRVKTRRVRVRQRSLRKKIGLSASELHILLSAEPLCSQSSQRPWIVLTIESERPTSDGFDVRVKVKNNGKAPVTLVIGGRETDGKTYSIAGLEVNQWDDGWQDLAPRCSEVVSPRVDSFALRPGETIRNDLNLYTSWDAIDRMCPSLVTARAGAKIRAVLYGVYESDQELRTDLGPSRRRTAPARVQSISNVKRLPILRLMSRWHGPGEAVLPSALAFSANQTAPHPPYSREPRKKFRLMPSRRIPRRVIASWAVRCQVATCDERSSPAPESSAPPANKLPIPIGRGGKF